MVVIFVVMDQYDVILFDELNYVFIIDGCCLFRVKVICFKYLDMNDLRWLVKEVKEFGLYYKIMVIIDGVFFMDGDIVKLFEIVKIVEEFDLIIYVDDVYGLGVFGVGVGIVKYFELFDCIDF